MLNGCLGTIILNPTNLLSNRENYKREEIEEYLYLAADILIEVEHEEDEDEEDEEDGNYAPPTIFSRSSRGKKSQISKASKAPSKALSKASRPSVKPMYC